MPAAVSSVARLVGPCMRVSRCAGRTASRADFPLSSRLLALAAFAAVAWIPLPMASAQSPAWRPLQIQPRDQSAMVYDSARHEIVLFGGSRSSHTFFGDTWRWTGSDWYRCATTGPSPRYWHAMAYDSARGVTVLYGGYVGCGETWEWDGDTWTRRQVPGPTACYGHDMAYDSARRVTVLFGGEDHANETWEWDGTTWIQRPVSGPPGRTWHGMAYDSRRHVTVLFGGEISSGVTNDTWEWDGSTWTQRLAPPPPPARDIAMAFDASRAVTLMRSGSSTWSWDGSVWTLLSMDGPPSTRGHAMAFDEARNAVTVLDSSGVTWAWDGAAWSIAQNCPPDFDWPLMVYDSVRSALLLVTGTTSQTQTWSWNGSAWTQLGPCPFTSVQCMAFDARRGVAVLFDTMYQTWEWDGAQWTRRAVTGPQPFGFPSMTYDSARGVCVLVAGNNSGSGTTEDTREWDGVSWQLRAMQAQFPTRSHAVLVFDPIRSVSVLTGGGVTFGNGRTSEWNGVNWTDRGNGPVTFDGSTGAFDLSRGATVACGDAPTGDVWQWDGIAWTSLPASPPRYRPALAFYPPMDRLVLFGGDDYDPFGGANAQMWTFDPGCSAPSLTLQPVSQTTCVAGSALFGVAASGPAPLTYQWQLRAGNGPWISLSTSPSPLPCGGSASIAPDNWPSTAISITPCAGLTQFQIRCAVWSACGTTNSDPATYNICYANCDCSPSPSTLNVGDFICFESKFAAGDSYANCDGSTFPPVLNVNDFLCFQRSFANGCP